MLANNSILKDRWKIVKPLGQGAFGSIYCVSDLESGQLYAAKLERRDSKRSVLKIEVAFMRKVRKCPSVPAYITCGTTRSYNFLIEEMCGTNLGVLRKSRPEQRFSLTTVLKLGISMVACMKDVHAAGYIHRDIKPSNFVLGHGNNRVYIIDFGLARKNTDAEGNILPARKNPGFRGTARYASVASHQCKDLSIRDDYWSLLYLMIEMLTGFLPWRRLKDRERIGEMKAMCTTHDTLTSGLPSCFERLLNYIKGLAFTEKADHERIQSFFVEEMRARSLPISTEYDWSQTHPPMPYQPTTALYSRDQRLMRRPSCVSDPNLRRPSSLNQVHLPSVTSPTAHTDAVPIVSVRSPSVARLPSLERNTFSTSTGFSGEYISPESPRVVVETPSPPVAPSPLKHNSTTMLCSPRPHGSRHAHVHAHGTRF
ncbi:Protein kinase domain [Carpediemonas membranifera]|uniref:non-specific serine/threonine protein kinase n=1 Tax=Carpediemonas membranifera TaxID=201153 RepID=A0A8J6AVQ8_9EUKA|nr:Protein kinase domain [Carpediemonas membranifera]|eukprot:KAG9395398.1 Protein kinase domain [Carpediemonas membranifera]